MKKCLFCTAIFHKGKMLKCQFCDHFLQSSKEMRDGLSYLEKSFSRLNDELNALEQKAFIKIGIIFKRYKYTAESLQDCNQMELIKSLAGKIKDDMARWDAAGKLPYRMRMIYNENADEVQERLQTINQAIQERRPTLWQRIGNLFKRLYKTIIQLLPQMLQKMIIGHRYRHVCAA